MDKTSWISGTIPAPVVAGRLQPPASNACSVHLGDGAVLGGVGAGLTVFNDSERLQFFPKAVREIMGYGARTRYLSI